MKTSSLLAIAPLFLHYVSSLPNNAKHPTTSPHKGQKHPTTLTAKANKHTSTSPPKRPTHPTTLTAKANKHTSKSPPKGHKPPGSTSRSKPVPTPSVDRNKPVIFQGYKYSDTIWDDINSYPGYDAVSKANITLDPSSDYGSSRGWADEYPKHAKRYTHYELADYITREKQLPLKLVQDQEKILKAQADRFSTASTVVWLENWIKNNMTDVKYSAEFGFYDAFLRSIEPIWPRGNLVNFRCSIFNPCEAPYPFTDRDTNPDAQYAYRVLIAIQNMNNWWRLQRSLTVDATNFFTATQANAFWNVLIRDHQPRLFDTQLPSIASFAMNLGTAIAHFREASRDVADRFAPYAGMFVDIIRIARGSDVVAPVPVGSATLVRDVGDYMRDRINDVTKAYYKITISDPMHPSVGFYTLFARDPQAYLPETTRALAFQQDDARYQNAERRVIRAIGAAMINAYYFSTGQALGAISGNNWNTNRACHRGSYFNHPLCLNQNLPGFPAWHLVYAALPRSSTTTLYRNLETSALLHLNDPLFTDPRGYYRFNALDVVRGSMRCQAARMQKGTFNQGGGWVRRLGTVNGVSTATANNLAWPRFYAAWYGRTDWSTGGVFYSSSFSEEDSCFWALPMMLNVWNVGQNNVRGARQMNMANTIMAEWIGAWNQRRLQSL